MENAERFSLRWDDFKANTSLVLKELRDETEFCDVTLACADGKQVSAHKVILAGCSSFFQQILKQNPHPHPLVYLKGVSYDYLLSILDFMYTGEANINQKEIESFLDVANDLQIKGLIDKNLPQNTSAEEEDMIHRNVSRQNERSEVKKEAGSVLNAKTPHDNSRGSQSGCEDGPMDTNFDANIKVELDDTVHSTASFSMEENRGGLNGMEEMMDFKTEFPNSIRIGSIFTSEQMAADHDYDRNHILVDDNVKTKLDIASFYSNFKEDSYVKTNDSLRSVDNKNQLFSDCGLTGEEPVNRVSKSEKNAHNLYEVGKKSNDFSVSHENQNDKEFCKVCSFCGKSFQSNSHLKVHIRSHTGEKPFPCLFCPKTFRKNSHLKEHIRIHTGEKPYQCLVCFQRFTQSSRLNSHKKQKQCSMKLRV